MTNSKNKSNKRLSKVNAPSKTSKRLQCAIESRAVFSTIQSEYVTELPADQITSFGQDNSILMPSQLQSQFFSFTQNTTFDLAALNNFNEDSLIDLLALRPNLVEMQSLIVAFQKQKCKNSRRKSRQVSNY